MDMKKKIACFAAVFTVIFAGTVIYFMPISLLDHVNDRSHIDIMVYDIGIRDGKPFIDPVTYTDITQEQKNTILKLCSQYSYRRTIYTLFSDGSISGLKGKVVCISLSDDNEDPCYIMVSAAGKMAVENKTFKMNDAEEFIEQIIRILEIS